MYLFYIIVIEVNIDFLIILLGLLCLWKVSFIKCFKLIYKYKKKVKGKENRCDRVSKYCLVNLDN